MEAQAIRDKRPLAAAEEKFHGLVERLSSAEARGMAHGELESLVAAEGREVQRRPLMGHLDVRAAGDRVLLSVAGADEVERTHDRRAARGLLMVFGMVTVSRTSYGASTVPLQSARVQVVPDPPVGR